MELTNTSSVTVDVKNIYIIHPTNIPKNFKLSSSSFAVPISPYPTVVTVWIERYHD